MWRSVEIVFLMKGSRMETQTWKREPKYDASDTDDPPEWVNIAWRHNETGVICWLPPGVDRNDPSAEQQEVPGDASLEMIAEHIIDRLAHLERCSPPELRRLGEYASDLICELLAEVERLRNASQSR
jgi:hypothetical protein